MPENERKPPIERLESAIEESDGMVEFTWKFTKSSYWGKHIPDGLQISVPWWAVAGGSIIGGSALMFILFDHLGKLDRYKPSKGQVKEYGPDRVTLDDINYARNEMGPIVTPMEWMVGVPLYARAHRDYRMSLAADLAAPTDAGIPDSAQPAVNVTDTETGESMPLSNWHIPLFELTTGEKYIAIFIPSRRYDEYPNGYSQEYWLMTDGSQQNNTNAHIEGTVANKLKAQAKQ